MKFGMIINISLLQLFYHNIYDKHIEDIVKSIHKWIIHFEIYRTFAFGVLCRGILLYLTD